MREQSPLVTLRELAQTAAEQAAIQLAQVRQSHQQMEQQLNMLIGYQDEYRVRLNETLNLGGMSSASWQNYQQFLKTLELTIEQHKQQLLHWQEQLDLATNQWREKQQRLNAFETLEQRAEDSRKRHLDRIEQKQMDEYAQRSTLRRTT
ncbi:MAG TPA: flagella biosynthesis chaperone FliJ [Proteus sp.]|uniref:Flagellar FliJ protein n=1 Tax=Proteus hauseri ATCC 700826 TaxID=1354271 RepID=A0AAJ3LT83_PROHU|nr:flagellar export protein FliJ [Proteus hauseri]OAT46146.1 FliJ family flagellar protein [Proteus hauseri ATCC 700826]QAV25105.1 flagella biosynthesis chaperone FliJ [Proteus hauseri]HCH50001.1 flagella biosynthesis chaperone FliJ [Proteus sp. (in: enterobacteria)]